MTALTPQPRPDWNEVDARNKAWLQRHMDPVGHLLDRLKAEFLHWVPPVCREPLLRKLRAILTEELKP